MAQQKKYKFLRSLNLIPSGLVNSSSKMAIPASVTIPVGTILMATEENGRLKFTYGAFLFDKEYDTQSKNGKRNRLDIRLAPQNTGVVPPKKDGSTNTPTNTIVEGDFPTTKPSEPSPSPTKVEKSTTTKNMFEFKDKLHAGITFVATAFGVYYAYKTKGKVKDYLMYGGGGLVLGFVLGNLASSYVSTPKASEKALENDMRDVGKPLDSKPISSNSTSDLKSQGVETDEINPTMESFM